ncbi:hypothetical protein EVAR_23700_1 [Eumeta japonica]|uniref:Uncharacterized protein n=1 Tax=Eumeta variegata TaxID=151549 RepID=A0A4C1VGA6_EUMVA|nr:hypothetical protein EVAR_23700_1 [Eumeta japonica]
MTIVVTVLSGCTRTDTSEGPQSEVRTMWVDMSYCWVYDTSVQTWQAANECERHITHRGRDNSVGRSKKRCEIEKGPCVNKSLQFRGSIAARAGD